MRYKYKYIEFKQGLDASSWLIINHKYKQRIGCLDYNRRWKEWELVPDDGTGWTIECLNDITHFINQLQATKLS